MKDKSLTAFRKKVLLAVLKIPEGEVRTYSQVAVMAGSPKACRAVGQALKMNPYAPDVPCHRVIRSDGSTGGFTGGAGKKRKLLREEGYLCV
ncbi:MAG: methylated-DNA--[protein]-cysteine S-methyltransferase [Candidatus Omnitrophica bacterium]|nr:methylated-DNA--[protein]-cysteine S-methyltransferase [Candidatus Omnitrophota bacterium]